MAWEALSNPHRRKIIQYLKKREKMTPTELSELIDVAPSTLSEHLKDLERAKLVRKKRDGQNMIYSIDEEGMKKFHKEYMKSIGGNFIDSVVTQRRGVRIR